MAEGQSKMPDDRLGFVLVHGGGATGACWARVLPHLIRPAVAVDLPGRGSRPANVRRLGVDDFVTSVVEDVEAAGFERVVLVGHSLAGVVLPGVAERLPDLIVRLAFVSCTIPPEGGNVLDSLPPAIRCYTRWRVRRGKLPLLPPAVARRILTHDVDGKATDELMNGMTPEPARLATDRVSRQGLPADVPRTYVMLLRDRALPVRTQRRQIANLGPCDVVALDAGHSAFLSHPRALALLLNAVAIGSQVRQSPETSRSVD